jgi:Uncharacterized conserved protein
VDIISLVLIAVVVLVVIGIAAAVIGIYNRFFSLKNSAEATVGQVKVAMKKRLDMIEQLLGAVKSYAAFEKETLIGVTAMRARIGSAGPGDLNELERESRSVLGRLLAVAENYPDLKTSQTVQELMGAIKGDRRRDRPASLHLQQHRPAVQHHDRHDPLEFSRRRHGLYEARVPGVRRGDRAGPDDIILINHARD